MIVFHHVSKTFPLGTVALDNVSFTIAKNEFVFLTGTSGAGKTTIIKLIPRFLTPTSGKITVDGVIISDKHFPHTEKLRQSIGVVFQDFKVLHENTVLENIALALKVVKWDEHTMHDEVKRVLALVGLSSKEHLFPVQLSAGELQRVAIARAICGDRHILLADEPTGNLDPKTSWEIMGIFKKLSAKKTIIIATHNVDIVSSLKKRVITLEKGRIIKDKKGGYDI
ncbi:MAG TPA: ATP-binding cassette domain-containing protein [Patescibacteria group bacterium]|nr:ATP-binding cassette domain-containing protein [Patescibacteria group bacterium]